MALLTKWIQMVWRTNLSEEARWGKAWLADEVPGKVVELFEENDGNFREHKCGRIWEWTEWEGQWSSPIKGADRALREVDLQTCVCPIPLAKFQKRAYCSCPISSDMPLCTCLIIFGQPLAEPHPSHDLIQGYPRLHLLQLCCRRTLHPQAAFLWRGLPSHAASTGSSQARPSASQPSGPRH